MLLFRAEGENPVLPGTGPAVTTKSDDDDDQLDDDHDEQCKYNDGTMMVSIMTEASLL